MTTTVSRVAFYRAVAAGDLDVVASYWAQPHVRADVLDTDAYIQTHAPADAGFSRDGHFAWYYTQEVWHPYDTRSHHYPEFLLGTAVQCGHVHVLQWLFAQREIQPTLKLLLPMVMGWAQWEDPYAVDVLLTSSVFTSSMTPAEQATVLDKALRFCGSPAVADVLIAHGARVNPPDGVAPVRHAADIGRFALVRRLIALGADWIGVPDLDP